MKYRTLGKSKIKVSEIGLGGLFLGSKGRENGIRIVRRALELGINYFDTAPSYQIGDGTPYSQEVLGEALDGVRESHFVSTKIGPSPLFPSAKYDYDSIMKQIDHNLKQLRRDKIDIVFIHDPDRYGDPINPGNYHPVFGRGMALESLHKLKEEKIINAVGIASLWLDYQAYCVERGVLDVILTFNRYGLIWRDAQFQLFPFCRKHEVGIVQGTPFHQGIFTCPHHEWKDDPPEWMNHVEHDRYQKLLLIQENSGICFPELALRFLLTKIEIGSIIQGATSVKELEENVACSDLGPLPPDISEEIESIGIMHEDPRRLK